MNVGYIFGAFGDYSRPLVDQLLSTLVDITSCYEVIKTASQICRLKSP